MGVRSSQTSQHLLIYTEVRLRILEKFLIFLKSNSSVEKIKFKIAFGAKYLNAVPMYVCIVHVIDHEIKMVTLLTQNF